MSHPQTVNKKIRVVIADDHEIFRDGLRDLLQNNPNTEFVGEASNGKELVALATLHKPDIALADLRMPIMGGVEAINILTQLPSPVKCIALSNFEYEQIIVESLEAGAMGYISKSAEREEIIEAIQTVYDGYYYYCKRTTARMMKLISTSKYNPQKNEAFPALKTREKEIIRLICQQKTSEEIGKLLFLSKKAIEKERLAILAKIGEKTSIGMVIYAIKNGIYSVEE